MGYDMLIIGLCILAVILAIVVKYGAALVA